MKMNFITKQHWLNKLTSSLSVKLKSHGDMPEPCARFDFHVSCVDMRR